MTAFQSGHGFISGFNRSKTRHRPPKPPVPDQIDDNMHVWTCPYRDRHRQKCDRKPIGPYYNLTLMKDAIRQHLAAQHVNELSPMERTDKSDERMHRADTQINAYEGPSTR